MVYVISPKEMVLFNGYGLFLLVWTLSASRRPIVCRVLNVLCGSGLLVSFLLCLLALRIRVVALFFSALRYLFLNLDLILLVAFSNASFLFKTRPFGYVQSTAPTAILIGICFWMNFIPGLILPSQLFLLVISTRV